MKLIRYFIIGVLFTAFAFAQTPEATFIKGDLNIRYLTRTQLDGSKPKDGVEDIYTFNVNVSNSAQFRGYINHRPYIDNIMSDQEAQLTFAVDLDVVNPRNPSQTKNVGKLSGIVPISKENVYDYDSGTAQISVFTLGAAKGFESKLRGTTLGKPPANKGMFDKLTKVVKERINLTKSVGGKATTIAVTNYDKMEFVNHVLAAGPVQIYGEVTVNGILLYDYDRESWFFQDITVTYPVDGRMMIDKLTGNVRWNDNESRYEFDVRVNEPPPSESSIFDGPADESAFFAVDTGVASLTGEMVYKDTVTDDTVTSSIITINLTGNQLTKHQTMYLAKLILFSTAVPFNAE